jgi:hypothetical protein
MGWWKQDDRQDAGRKDRYAQCSQRRQPHTGARGAVRDVQAEIWERPGPRSKMPEQRPRRSSWSLSGR